MRLIRDSLDYANKQPIFRLFVILTFINDIVMSLVISDWIYRISQGSIGFIPYVVILKLINTLLGIYVQRLANNVSNSVGISFNMDANEKYTRLSFKSKNKSPAESYHQVHNTAIWPMCSIIEWGLPTSCSLLGTFIGCVWTFFRLGLLIELVSTIIISSTIWYFYVRNQHKIFSEFHKEIRIKTEALREKVQLLLPGFQYNEVSLAELNNHDKKINEYGYVIQEKWSTSMTYSTLLNEFTVLVISYCTMTDHAKYMLVAMVLGNLSGAITSLNQFFNQYNRLTNDYDSYVNFWNDLEFIEKPIEYEFPPVLEVTKVQIENGGFTVSLDPSIKKLSIGKGCKTLIKGPTGHGKSTLINGLTGKIPGVELNYGKPENYYHATAEMYQNIREKTPSSKVTLRDYFRGEKDDYLIIKCLEPCFDTEELNKLFKALRDQDSDKNKELDIEAQVEKVNPLDCRLNEIPSGGQKSRLCIATRIYDMKKNNKSMLILDEPEQGSDPEMAVKVLQNVCQMFDTIIVVTHMCDCQLAKLGIKWTNQLEVLNGIVSERRFV